MDYDLTLISRTKNISFSVLYTFSKFRPTFLSHQVHNHATRVRFMYFFMHQDGKRIIYANIYLVNTCKSSVYTWVRMLALIFLTQWNRSENTYQQNAELKFSYRPIIFWGFSLTPPFFFLKRIKSFKSFYFYSTQNYLIVFHCVKTIG